MPPACRGYRRDVPDAPVAKPAPIVAGGAIWDVVSGPGSRVTRVKLQRCPAGWQASFELTDGVVADLAVVHRLVAPTLREARAAVYQAIGFLLGNPVEDCQ
jgi:hypothetical protein